MGITSEIFGTEFYSIQEEIDREQHLKEDLREVIREIEQLSRDVLIVLQSVYTEEGLKQIPEICKTSREMFSSVRDKYGLIKDKISIDQYYKYNDLWRYVTQKLVYIAAYIVFLESGKLITRVEAAQFLGVQVIPAEGFHLDLDDLLFGWIQLAEELPRLSVCSATFDNHKLPYLIYQFVTEMENQCRILGLRGDSVRKKIESLRYGSKKAADVIYDLSIRGLLKSTDPPTVDSIHLTD